MSKPDCVVARPIPTGILAPETPRVCPAERPTPRRPRTSSERSMPWLWIATGGSLIWTLAIVVMALYTVARESAQASVGPAACGVAVATPQAAEMPAVMAPPKAEPILAVEPAPIVPEPQLPFRAARLIPGDDAPPPLTIVHEEEALDTPKVPPAEPKPELKVAKKNIDLNVYANCEQIGTNILFMKNPTEVFNRARAENKLVFMVHLSGNFEDKEFT